MIATERLLLRVPEPRDRAALHAMWADPLVMADLGPIKDEAASDATIAKHDGYRHEGLGFRVVERRSDGAMIGFCGLKRGESHLAIHGELEAGWTVASPFWGQGYAYEAMAAMLDWGWANTADARIVAITSARNVKSQRLMEKLGMARLPDGDYESASYPPGDPLRASVTFAISRP
ncbi:GNAT family N-acetyltransferase [Sphingomonas immobilis]|uniref:GNAT family N-acetyltransferase n=1 Tax=Sphingomonas immobilis TaxID=3063997 RepID=A0ABT8ZZH6_9SPHN|nr:GNAT family N-acetyltransferase [Sphingomonas sp. CA1-15]MDO7842986.1 GNAT family N-acetyltransferase [Sphingomonas sp. CA1-15]